jgi:Protein of unknown function (DUF3618)
VQYGQPGTDDGGGAVSEARTPAQIEAEIAGKRQQLAATLDEIATRVHPKTIVNDVRARTASVVDHTAGRAFVAANRVVSDVRKQLVSPEGAPRMERIAPVALTAVAVVGLLAMSSRRPHTRRRAGRRRR